MGSFKPIEIADKETIGRYLRLYPDNEGSECTFSNLFIWGKGDEVLWTVENDGLLLHVRDQQGDPCLLMAFAPPDALCRALNAAVDAMRARGEPFRMCSLPAWYCELMRACQPGRFAFEREPWHDDYIYSTADLIDLPGRAFHGKRNHIRKFQTMYAGRYLYEPYTSALREDCLAVYARWFATQDATDDLQRERGSVERALAHMDALGLVGGVLRLDGRIEAFSAGERIAGNMALIHIEKANPDIQGLFAMINRELAANAFADTLWINREEDMGIEGLRRAKRSYNPARMIEKYSATLLEM